MQDGAKCVVGSVLSTVNKVADAKELKGSLSEVSGENYSGSMP